MSDQSPVAAAEPEFAAFVAIDWADQKHYWRLAVAGSPKQEQGVLDHTPEAVAAWATELAVRFGGQPIAVCLEQRRGALISMLSTYGHLVLFPVHPRMIASFRTAFYPSGSKSDPSDTDLLLMVLLRHRERLRPLKPDTVQTRLLQRFVEQRRRMVDERTRQSNRLTDSLKQYFPQILGWFEEVSAPLVGDLLERWPTLDELKRCHDGTLRKFFHQHNCRSEQLIQKRIEAIRQAVPATQDEAVVQSESLAVRGLVRLIATLRTHIAELDKQIAEVFGAHPDSALFDSPPGAGPAMAPRLLVAFGSDRERFVVAGEIQSYSGIGPVTERSGQSQWVHFRWACPKFVRQTFHEFAGHSLVKSEWAQAYYQLQISRGKSHHAAVRALAYKWIRILHRCWKNRTPYDEQTYLAALHKRNSPLKDLLPSATGLGWKSIAGFQNFSADPS
jgi:transposase